MTEVHNLDVYIKLGYMKYNNNMCNKTKFGYIYNKTTIKTRYTGQVQMKQKSEVVASLDNPVTYLNIILGTYPQNEEILHRNTIWYDNFKVWIVQFTDDVSDLLKSVVDILSLTFRERRQMLMIQLMLAAPK